MYVHILYTYFGGSLTAPGSTRMIQSRNYIKMLAVIDIIVHSIHLQISSDSLILY